MLLLVLTQVENPSESSGSQQSGPWVQLCQLVYQPEGDTCHPYSLPAGPTPPTRGSRPLSLLWRSFFTRE